MSTVLEFKPFGPDSKPHDLRLCYIYSNTIPKEQAHIAQWDEDAGYEGEWYSLDKGENLRPEHIEGLHWGHLPLPFEYADKND